MATIPNVTQIKRRNDYGQMDVATFNPSGSTAAIDETSKFINDLREKRLKSDISKAEMDLSIYLESQKTAFDHDEDYKTIEERWNKGVFDKLSETAGSIPDAQIREAFVQKYRPVIESQRNFIRDTAWGKEKDQDRADVLQRMQTAQDVFARSGDANLVSTGSDLIDNAKGFDEEEKVKYKQAFRVGAVKARLDAVGQDNPQKAIDLLNTDVAVNNLPEGERARMMKAYQDRNAVYQSFSIVDDYMERGLTLSAGIEESRSIEDPVLRDKVERRFTQELRLQEAAKVTTQATIHEQWHTRIGPRGDGSSIADIPMDQWELLSPEQQENLNRLDNNPTKVLSDPDVLIKLSGLGIAATSSGDWTAYNKYLSENSSRLSRQDQVSRAVVPLENQAKMLTPDSGLTDPQKVAGALGENADTNTKAKLLNDIGRWRIRQQEAGHNPTDKEVIEFIDNSLIEYSSGWFGSDKYFNLSEDQRAKNLQSMKDENPNRYDSLLKIFGETGKNPDVSEWMSLMRDDITDDEAIRRAYNR